MSGGRENERDAAQLARIVSLLNDEMIANLSNWPDNNEAFKIATILLSESRKDKSQVIISAKAVSSFLKTHYGVNVPERTI